MDIFDEDSELSVDAGSASDSALVSSRVALASVALEKALGAPGRRVLRREKTFAMVIEVPSEQWIAPVAAAVKLRCPRPIRFAKEFDRARTRAAENSELSAVLASGSAVVGVAHALANLPESLLAACTHRYAIGPVTGEVVASAMKLCMTGRAPAALSQLDLSRLDFDTLCACLPRGTAKRGGVDRLRRALQKNGPVTSENLALPPLEAAIEYGDAQRWGLELKADIADLHSGRISWRDVDRGAVLEGPPGSGKTTFAQILGRSCGIATVFGSISELFASSAGYLDSVIKAQRKLFDEARAAAPCLLFLDELNALPDPATISQRGRDWWLPVIMDFYLLLDSAVSAREGIIVLGATNRIQDISPAALRPGRLERAIHIGLPSPEGLANIMRTHLGEDLKEHDLLPLARAGAGATAAEAMEWVRSARRISRRAGRPLELADLAAQVTPADNRGKGDRHRMAVHEAGHAIIGSVLGEKVLEVSIIPRGSSGGRTVFAQPENSLFDREGRERIVTRTLAGLAAEVVILGSASNGAGGDRSSDLARASNVLASLRTSFGMGDRLLWRGEPYDAETLLRRDTTLQTAVEADLQRLYAEAEKLAIAHKGRISELAGRLMARSFLSGEDLGLARTVKRPTEPTGLSVRSTRRRKAKRS